MELSRRNRRLIAVLACASALGAAAVPSAAPAAPRARTSIVGGGRADPAQWPFAVAIFRKGHMHCSGSVIGPTKVLTAGHCVDGFNLANLQVIIGRPTLRDASVGQSIGVVSGRVQSRLRADGPARRGGAQSRPADGRHPGGARHARPERRDDRCRSTDAGGRLRSDQSVRNAPLGLPEVDDRAIPRRQPLPEGLHARPLRPGEHDLRAGRQEEEARVASRSTPRPAPGTAAVRSSRTPRPGRWRSGRSPTAARSAACRRRRPSTRGSPPAWTSSTRHSGHQANPLWSEGRSPKRLIGGWPLCGRDLMAKPYRVLRLAPTTEC